jgi:hypothetical protein
VEEDHRLGAEADGVVPMPRVLPARPLVMVRAISSGTESPSGWTSRKASWRRRCSWGAWAVAGNGADDPCRHRPKLGRGRPCGGARPWTRL